MQMLYSIKHKNPSDVHLGGACITSTSCEKLLGITIDSDLKFDKNISDFPTKLAKKDMHYFELQVIYL